MPAVCEWPPPFQAPPVATRSEADRRTACPLRKRNSDVNRLSILIPWVQNDAAHEDTLASVLAHRPADCEILVAHRGAYEDPYDLAEEVVFLEGRSDASALQLLNLAADEADGDILHPLSGGLEVTDGWADEALELFADEKLVSVAPLVVDGDQTTVLSAGVFVSAGRRQVRRTGSLTATELSRDPVGPCLQAGFYRVEAWDAASGLDESMGLDADLDLALCLRALGDCRTACGSRIRQASPAPALGGLQRGRTAGRLFRRHAEREGFSRFGFWSSTLVRSFGRPLESLGVWLGSRDQRDQRRFEQRLDILQSEAAELARIAAPATARRAA